MTFEEMDKALKIITRIENLAIAYNQTAERNQDAQNYAEKYLMPDAAGKNIWHAILDDAIRMRKEMESTK